MQNALSKTPFLALLIPLISGIVLQYYFNIQNWSIAFFLLGAIVMLFSYLIPKDKEFRLRWLFGAGLSLFLIGIGITTSSYRQQESSFIFSDQPQIYRAIVTDTPEDKPRSVAYKVRLSDLDKQIVCYFQRDTLYNTYLMPGDEFLFKGEIQAFKNQGNPDDFDYVSYMHDKGFAGSVYIPSDSWQATGRSSSSLITQALRCRQHILIFYKSLGFNNTEYAILSALTLGYQDVLSDDLKQSFRTTGTVHVLSVSGLHVGIIYLMISFLLSFIRRNSKYYWLKPTIIIVLLWVYAFITGLPPSVIRASAMLTVFCVSEVFNRKNFSVNALYITAFFMLLISPFSLFDIGFQLSFMSVLAILYLQPLASNLLAVKNKYLRAFWQMFTLSLVAQLGTFPLCLYYFGTFPTYFFISNLLIVPLVSLITYSVAGIFLAKLLSYIMPSLSVYLFYLPVNILKLLVGIMTSVIEFFEKLPFALIEDAYVSLFDLFLIAATIISFLLAVIYKKPRSLLVGLSSILIFFSIHLYDNLCSKPDSITVYNRRNATEIKWNIGHQNYMIENEDQARGYKLVEIDAVKLLIISKNIWRDKQSDEKFVVDCLVLTGDNSLSLYSLTQLFSMQEVVVDASLSAKTVSRLKGECLKLNIPCYDVAQNGAYSLIF